MAEERNIRINKVLRELNISLDRAVDFLKDKGVNIDASPNAKISQEEYTDLVEQFSNNKTQSKYYAPLTIEDIQRELNLNLKEQYIDLSNTQFERNSYCLNEHKQIIRLHIDKLDLKNLFFLRGQSKMTHLYVESNALKDISMLSNLQSLQFLTFKSYELENVKPIRNLYQLQYLCLNGYKISDISSLANLKKLEILNLRGNKISDVNPLKALPVLKELILDDNELSDITSIKNLTSLKQIGLDNNNLRDITILQGISNLIKISCAGNSIERLPDFRKFTTIQSINASGNPLRKFTLGTLENLHTLQLNDVNLHDLNFFEDLPVLRNLSLSSCQIDNIEALENLESLTFLNISHNNIGELTPLKHLKALRTLLLNENSIVDILALINLEELEELNLSGNEIIDISPLSALRKLTYLSVTNNKIIDIAPLQSLTKLKKLFLNDNRIFNLKPLKTILDNLEVVVLFNNPIVDNQGWKIESLENSLSLIKNYLSIQEEDLEDFTLPVKVLLLGNHGTGKSTLLNYLLNEEEPKQIEPEKNSTHIIRIEKYPNNITSGEMPAIMYFDFGGQDYYHGIYKAFLTNDTLNLLLWNYISDVNQVRKDTRDFSRQYWLHQLKYYYNKKRKEDETEPILLIQTRADDEHSCRKNFTDDCDFFTIKNEFYIALDQNIIDKNKVSKASLNFLVAQIEEEIAQKKKVVSRPQWYKFFLNKILSSDDPNPTPIKEVLKFYQRKTYGSETELDIIEYLKDDLDQLHKQGLVLYYKDFLPDVVWLNPMNTVQNIHDNILSAHQLKVLKGTINESDFIHDQNVLELLKLQKVLFYDKFRQVYVVPNFLPLISEDLQYSILTFGFNKIDFSLKFDKFLPFGLVNQLICHFGNNKDSKHFWRDQIVFTLNNESKILLKLDFSTLEINIYCHFLTNDLRRQEVIKKYILNCILAIYWDKELIEFDQFLKNYEFLNRNVVDPIPVSLDDVVNTKRYDELTSEEKLKIDTDNYNQKVYYNFIGVFDQFPDDMHFSIDALDFVHGQSFLKLVDSGEFTVPSYPVEKSGNINHSNSKEKSIFNYKLFSNNKLRKMKKIFISYSRKDVDYKNELKKHLNILKTFDIADNWSCEEITIGKWDEQIQKELEESDLIIYMLSANFFSSKYILEKEVQKGFDLLAKNQSKKVLCVIVSNFVGLDKLKSSVENRGVTTLQDSLFKLNENQYLPYGKVYNSITKQNEEVIIPLKTHSDIDSALEQITSKIAAEL